MINVPPDGPGPDPGNEPAASADALLPVVYEELRRLAHNRMAGEAGAQILQPTALVHEAWMRLASGRQDGWDSRAHFFAAAAEAMRRVLVEEARRRNRIKRGGGVEPVPLDDSMAVLNVPPEELLSVHEALDRLAAADPQAAELVKLRYFVGLDMAAAAATLGVSKRLAEKTWTRARLWLHRAIRGGAAAT